MAERDYKSYGILDNEIDHDQELEASHKEPVITLEKKSDSIQSEESIQTEKISVQDIQQDIQEELQEDAQQDGILESGIQENNIRENDMKQDTSFVYYKKQKPFKQTSSVVKWLFRLVKLIIFIMLLPFITIVVAGIGAMLTMVVAAIIACLAIGISVLGIICFMSSQISGWLITLGIMCSLAFLSFGGIIIVLSLMLIKWIVRLVKRRRLKYGANKKKK